MVLVPYLLVNMTDYLTDRKKKCPFPQLSSLPPLPPPSSLAARSKVWHGLARPGHAAQNGFGWGALYGPVDRFFIQAIR